MYCVTRISINHLALGETRAKVALDAVVLELTDMVDSFTCYPMWHTIVIHDGKKGYVAIKKELEKRHIVTKYFRIESLDNFFDFKAEAEKEKEGRG